MKRRTFLAGVGATATGSITVIGSGAFTSVEAQRNVQITVADDASAYLRISECSFGDPNTAYVSVDEDTGILEIDMSSSNPTEGGGEGVNANATSLFDDVFQVENQGTQEILFWIEADPIENAAGEPSVEFYRNSSSNYIISKNNRVPLKLGWGQCIGIKTSTEGLSSETSLLEDNTITIHAEEYG